MKKSTAILIWGGITSIAMVLYLILMNVNELSISGWYYFSLLIIFLGLFVGVRQYRDKCNDGYLNFGEGYVVTLLMTIIIAIVGFLNLLITLHFEPDLGDKLLHELQIKLINAGLSNDQINSILERSAESFHPNLMLRNTIIGNIFTGAILGLIAAGLNTKKKPIFDDSNEMPASDTPQA